MEEEKRVKWVVQKLRMGGRSEENRGGLHRLIVGEELEKGQTRLALNSNPYCTFIFGLRLYSTHTGGVALTKGHGFCLWL